MNYISIINWKALLWVKNTKAEKTLTVSDIDFIKLQKGCVLDDKDDVIETDEYLENKNEDIKIEKEINIKNSVPMFDMVLVLRDFCKELYTNVLTNTMKSKIEPSIKTKFIEVNAKIDEILSK